MTMAARLATDETARGQELRAVMDVTKKSPEKTTDTTFDLRVEDSKDVVSASKRVEARP